MEELIQRCSWATTDLYKEYHDNEWGKPVHDENKLFEMLILEGMQAGLSWLTIWSCSSNSKIIRHSRNGCPIWYSILPIIRKGKRM